jgi:ABC-type lipoprotein export system ATPase subunit
MTDTAHAPRRTPPSTGEPILSVRDVFCVHRTEQGDTAALQGASLDARGGEIVCVLGPSGAGKSTLLRVIAGLQTPSAGDVIVRGRDIGRLPSRERAALRHQLLGFLSQHADATLAPDLRLQDAVGLPLALRGVPRSERRRRVNALLDRVGLDGRERAWPHELSGGERQRAALCAALVHRPALLLADEPTGELDAASAANVRALIAAMCREAGAATVLVSHDPLSGQIADRTLVIRDGRVAEQGLGGSHSLVVSADGWVRLPTEMLARASIGRHVRVKLAGEELRITRAGEGVDRNDAEDGSAVPVSPRARVSSPGLPVSSGVTVSSGLTVSSGVTVSSGAPAHVTWSGVYRARGRGAGRRTVLSGHAHDLATGQMTALVGPSGSGKTTLLRIIAGIDRPDAGTVTLDERPLDGDSEERARLRRERIGYLPQDPAPVPFLSAEENIVLALQLRGWPLADAHARAAVVLARVGLADRSRQHVVRLSAGETQRVALARALAGARGLLVADEPTSRLDRDGAAVVADLLAAAAAREGQTVLCATHDEAVIARADAVLELDGTGPN